MISLIPPQYKLAALGIALALTFSAGAFSGWRVESWRWGASETAAVTAAIEETNKANAKAIADMRAEMQKASEAALADQAQQRVVTQTVVKWKDRLINAPLDPEACRPATARDLAVLDGLRAIIAAADPNPGPAGASPTGADSGHSPAGSTSSNHDTRPARPSDPRPGGVGNGPASAPVPSAGLGSRLREVIGR